MRSSALRDRAPILLLVFCFSSACSLSACSATPEPAPEPTPEPPAHGRHGPGIDSDDLCKAYCGQAVSCGIVESACAESCPGRGRDISGLRADYVGNLMMCLDGAGCNGIKSQDAWTGCHDAVVKNLPVSRTLRRFCFQSARRAAKCARRDDADQSDCLVRFRYQDDATLKNALRCIDEPCGEVPICLAARLVP